MGGESLSTLTNVQMRSILAGLSSCPVLAELTVVVNRWPLFPILALPLASMPRLRGLHIRADSTLVWDDARPLAAAGSAITHLALGLNRQMSAPLIQSISTQHLPHLSHCYVGHNYDWSIHHVHQEKWRDLRVSLEEQLGSVWCKYEDEVVCQRADRVWKRSVGLRETQTASESRAFLGGARGIPVSRVGCLSFVLS